MVARKDIPASEIPAADPASIHPRVSGSDSDFGAGIGASRNTLPPTQTAPMSTSTAATSRGSAAPIVGVFDRREDAQQALAELRRVGFREDQIGVISRDPVADKKDHTTAVNAPVVDDGTVADVDESHAAEGAVAGGLTGLGVGSLWALGIAAGVLPAIGPAIAGGILASVLTSAAAAGAAGGILGALIGLGVPEEDARAYESDVHAGRTLVTVRSPDRHTEAADILRRFGAHLTTSARA